MIDTFNFLKDIESFLNMKGYGVKDPLEIAEEHFLKTGEILKCENL